MMMSSEISADTPIDDKNLYQVFRLLRSKKWNEAEALLQKGLDAAILKNNKAEEGVYASSFGLLNKLKKNPREAYRFYQRAEKCLPDDAALKIVVAKFLIEDFHQFETAERKLEKIILSAEKDLAILHHALAWLGVALALQGKNEKIKKIWDEILAAGIQPLKSLAQVNFHFAEACVKKNIALDQTREFLHQAAAMAKMEKNPVWIKTIEALQAGLL